MGGEVRQAGDLHAKTSRRAGGWRFESWEGISGTGRLRLWAARYFAVCRGGRSGRRRVGVADQLLDGEGLDASFEEGRDEGAEQIVGCEGRADPVRC